MKRIPTAIAKDVRCSHWMIKKINQGKQPSLGLAIRIVEIMGNDAPRIADMIPNLRRAFEIMIKQGVG